MKTPFHVSFAGCQAYLRRRLGSGAGKLASAGLLAAMLCAPGAAVAQGNSTPAIRQMEKLGRGIVAVDQGNGKVFVSWRLLATDAPNVGFDLYRKSAGGTATKLNPTPLIAGTNFVDESPDLSPGTTYYVNPVQNGVPVSGGMASTPETAPVWAQQYMRLPLQRPAGGTVGTGTSASSYTYSPGDCSVGDLDGDGQYEIIVKWDPSNQKDNSQSGYTGNVLLDAYKLDGTRLWRIDLGRNIRAGAHYTQFMVYDLDGDGKSELACKTSDATIDGTGQVLGNANADYRNTAGYILSGPEYLTVFNGLTGAAYPSVRYLPQRHPTAGDNPTPAQINTIWGDNYGNRIDRFLAAVAYLDGVHPSLVMCRGYYTRTVLVAWDFKNGQLTERWTFDSDDPNTPAYRAYRGQGNHNLSVADVDGDGKDEIVYGSCAIDDNGKGLYTTGRGHGDAMHVSDLDPTRPGLEVFSVHETQSQYGSAPLDFRDAATGNLIWGAPGPNQGDIGRGVTMDIDPRTIGSESWGSRGGLYAANGTQISTARPSPINFAVWWDGDLLREPLDNVTISKWDWQTSRLSTLLNVSALGGASNNGTKATPNLSADLFGDWREEVIWRNANNDSELLIFTTTIPTQHRLTTLMQDSHYRVSIAWQNVSYNQPPHTGFYLGDGMNLDTAPPTILAAGFEVGLINGTRTIEAADIDYGSYDIGSGIASMTISPSTFTCANIGLNNVTITVTDSTGNSATQTVEVVVVDNTAPTILAAGFQVSLVNGTRTIDVADVDYGSYDDCGSVASMSISPRTFTCANVGPNEVTITVTDNAGNVATKKVTVDVRADNTCGSSLASNNQKASGKQPQLEAYPNPVADQATISFRPTQAGAAQVKIYNQLGTLVATLYDGTVEGNRLYQVSLDAAALSGGVYNCQLITNGKVVNKRLLINH